MSLRTVSTPTPRSTGSVTARCNWPAPASGAGPGDPGHAVAVLREAVALGVNFLETANAYGPRTVNRLIAAALEVIR